MLLLNLKLMNVRNRFPEIVWPWQCGCGRETVPQAYLDHLHVSTISFNSLFFSFLQGKKTEPFSMIKKMESNIIKA